MALRNIGIIAHIDAGKTTLSERILFYTDKIHRMGEVHEGAATMDFLPEEQDRGITIASACTTCSWDDNSINLIDTPGHVDFTMEVERSLRVLDGAVGVFCAVSGVEPQSETVWRQSEKFGVPKLAFVNKMDRPGASFAGVLDAMRQRLGANPVAVAVPLGEGEEFSGILDLVNCERVNFDQADQGRTVTRLPFTEADAALAAPWRETLIETAADEDDAILELFLGGGDVPPDMLRAAIRKGTLNRRIVPVFVGSALRNAGVQPLLDGVVAYLPGPADVPAQWGELPGSGGEGGVKTEVAPDPNGPFSALVFKVLMEGGRKLALVRIYSGVLREGMAVRNVSRSADEKITRMFRLHASRREELKEAVAGDIVAVQGIR
ncbi:GTP-binding protein, partial [Desulfovibrio sp. OttesenSCG-928-I05]|nr:GTP-binding protein [Desulfovibrio sp. OttesenSCG-928-I05]